MTLPPIEIPSFEFVDTADALQQVLAAIGPAGRVAIDMEADSLHHYFEKVCLIQVAISGRVFLIDSLAGLDLEPFFAAVSGKQLLFHAADYDLRMLRRTFAFRATSIFDTMVAAKLLGYERIGLSALVESHFTVQLPKHGQKADWSRRPLSPDLLAYAANDTYFLERLVDLLTDELAAVGRLDWHRESCVRIISDANSEDEPADTDKLWRVKGWRTLDSPASLGVLRSLWSWRDAEARRADLPTFKIMGNETLLALSKWTAAGSVEKDRPRIPRNIVGRRLHKLNDAMARGLKHPVRSSPKSDRTPPPEGGQRRNPPDQLIKSLKAARDEIATTMKLDPAILAPAAAIEAIARHRPSTPAQVQKVAGLHAWQADVLAGPLLVILGDGNEA